jgi:polyketide cyclase/dehydrase/lipid transport protein
MLIPILITLAVILALFIILVAMRPSDFRVTRSITVAAPAERAFEQVNELRNWEAWSPWAKLDPNAKNTYEGPVAGVGAAFAWSGNCKVGEGRLTITESRPHELVRFKLEFVKPFKGTNSAEFTFRPEGGETVVQWTMSGKKNFVSKAIGLVVNCDKMIGCQFDKGLAEMKSLAEAAATAQQVHSRAA